MKYNIKLENVEVAGVKVGAVEFGAEYSIGETRGMYQLVKEVTKDLPELIRNLQTGAMAFQVADREVEEFATFEDKRRDAFRQEHGTADLHMDTKFRMQHKEELKRKASKDAYDKAVSSDIKKEERTEKEDAITSFLKAVINDASKEGCIRIRRA